MCLDAQERAAGVGRKQGAAPQPATPVEQRQSLTGPRAAHPTRWWLFLTVEDLLTLDEIRLEDV
jgi:hypothetical protein